MDYRKLTIMAVDSAFAFGVQDGEGLRYANSVNVRSDADPGSISRAMMMALSVILDALHNHDGISEPFSNWAVFVFVDDRFSAAHTELARTRLEQIRAERVAEFQSAGISLDMGPLRISNAGVTRKKHLKAAG